jgi:hypothetical protein
MPSIFIWKSDATNNSNKKIKYHSGSNWVLEDTEHTSRSYMYLEQIVIPGFNDSVITFHIKQMPMNWIGSELLEIMELPYKHIKTDKYGTLEMIGDWMRFISKNEIDYNSEVLNNELTHIKKWMNNNDNININNNNIKPIMFNKEIVPTVDDIQHNFKKFFNKYNM